MGAEMHGATLQVKCGVAPANALRRYRGMCSGDGVVGSSG